MPRREAPEINAGSMADIAFLLLIFFLVTTTMDVDKGISRKLPPWIDEPKPDINPPIKKRNLFVVLVNASDGILVEYGKTGVPDNRVSEYVEAIEIRNLAKKFIDNFDKDKRSSENPSKAVISIQNDRGTSYEMFIAVQNELTAAYNELRDQEANELHGKPYSELNKKLQKEISKKYPMNISEAEPVSLAVE